MTKSTKQLLGLAGCLAVLGGVYGGAVLFNQYSADKKAEESKAQKEADTSWLSQMEEPVYISYTNSYGTFTFQYNEEEETWNYAADAHFPVTQSYLTALADDMKSLTAERKLEEVQEDLSVYGLEEPAYSITAKDTDNEAVTIHIGSINSYSSDYYAKLEGSDEIYTVSSSLVTDMSYDISALQEKESFPSIVSSDIHKISLTEDGTVVSFDKEVTTEPVTEEETQGSTDEAEASSDESAEPQTQTVTTWRAAADNRSKVIEDDTDVNNMLTNLTSLSFEDCADYYAEEEEKESFGLTDTAKMLTVSYASGDENRELVLTIGSTDEAGTCYYVSMDDSDEVNTISKESLDAILDQFSIYFQ